MGISYAQEKDTILSESGIAFPGGYYMNTVGDIQGKVNGNLYIIAQEIKITGSKKTLAFRSESGEALWSNRTQAGRTGSQGSGFGSQSDGFGSSSGGFGSSSGGQTGGGSSGVGRGRR